MRRRLVLALAALCLAGGAVPFLPARPADAYMLQSYPLRASRVNQLTLAWWPNNYNDTSTWFTNAVVGGASAWNGSETPVSIQVEGYANSKADIVWTTEQQTSNDTGPSSETCNVTDGDGRHCDQAILFLYEGSNNMQSGDPNYDQANVGHELGHALGLDHSCTANVLMSGPNGNCSNGGAPYSYSSETNAVTTPQQDDVNGVNHLYSTSANGGSGCSPTAPLPVPHPSLAPVPAFTQPQLPWNTIDGTEQTIFSDSENPQGAALDAVNAATATTAKAVPWSDVPQVPNLNLLNGVNRPC